MGFNIHAQWSTPPYYPDVDNPFVTGIACQGKPLHKKFIFLVLVLLFAYYSAQGSLKKTLLVSEVTPPIWQ